MHARTQEFRDLTDRLGLSAAETAAIIGRSRSTVLQYRSASTKARVPTEEVMDKLWSYWRSQLRSRLDRAVADLNAAGMHVEIGWGLIMSRAAAISSAVEAAIDESEVA